VVEEAFLPHGVQEVKREREKEGVPISSSPPVAPLPASKPHPLRIPPPPKHTKGELGPSLQCMGL
jgi:hypothetical protein